MKNIDLICPLNPTGYGQHGLNLALALTKLRQGVRIFPIGNIQCTPKQMAELEPYIAKKEINPKNIVVKLWHETDIDDKLKGDPFIYYPVFEISEFNEEQEAKFKLVNNYFVPSHWAKEVLAEVNPNFNINVIPEGVAEDVIYLPNPTPIFSLPTYINIGKHEIRKGTYQLLNMAKNYNLAEKMNLIIHCPNPFKDNLKDYLDAKRYKNDIDLPGITGPIKLSWFVHGNLNLYISNTFLSRENYLKLISYCDYGLFPYKAEGWNLPLTEVMASGIPCATTKVTGPTEYLTQSNSITINSYGADKVSYSEGYYSNAHPSAEWIRVNDSDILSACTQIPLAKSRIKSELSGFRNEWSWINAAKKFIAACEQYE